MFLSVLLILFLGLSARFIFEKCHLPGLLGMLIVGIIIGPFGLNLLDQSLLNVSGVLRKGALVIILIRAGLGLNKNDLQQVGPVALKMSFIPALFEGFTIALLSMYLLDFDFIRGGMLGFIIAAVSPAVVVPGMLKLIEAKVGQKKHLPMLVLSAASLDDIFVITIFSTFLSVYLNHNFNIVHQIISIPVSIILGVAIGLLIGYIVLLILQHYNLKRPLKVLIVLVFALFIVGLEEVLKYYLQIASLLGVMTIGFIISQKNPQIGDQLSVGFKKIWFIAEVFLFVLVGSEVNINLAISAGLVGLVIIFVGLIGRSIGVYLSVVKENLSNKEKLFMIISYMPKATVQAAIGTIPLANGVQDGEIILSIAVLSIIITAPLGATLINSFGPKLLENNS